MGTKLMDKFKCELCEDNEVSEEGEICQQCIDENDLDDDGDDE